MEIIISTCRRKHMTHGDVLIVLRICVLNVLFLSKSSVM